MLMFSDLYEEAWVGLSQKTGYDPQIFSLVFEAMLSQHSVDKKTFNKQSLSTAEQLCVRFIIEVMVRHEGNLAQVQEVLKGGKLLCSEDLACVVYAMIDQGVLKEDIGDAREDFNGVFSTDKLKEFVSRFDIHTRVSVLAQSGSPVCKTASVLGLLALVYSFSMGVTFGIVASSVLLACGVSLSVFERKWRANRAIQRMQNARSDVDA